MSRPLALITGASSGIGAAIAKQLAGDHDLVLVARRTDALEQVAASLKETISHVVGADLARPEGARELVAEVRARGLAIDVLVNNAGFGVTGDVVTNDPTQLDEMIAVNVAAVTHLTRAFLPAMVEKRAGGVLNVASTAGFQPGPGMAGYYATKAYVVSFTEALAYELRNSGVRVTALCPGPVATGFGARSGNDAMRLFQSPLFAVADADTVAKAAVDGWRAGKTVVVPGIVNKVTVWTSGTTPRFVGLPITAWLQSRKG